MEFEPVVTSSTSVAQPPSEENSSEDAVAPASVEPPAPFSESDGPIGVERAPLSDDPRVAPSQRRVVLIAVLAIATVAGTLRYYDIASQIPLGDEWHSLSRVANTSLYDVATHYFKRATSIPVNTFQRWVLEVWGWNEVTIRLLSILSGLATLVLLPLGVFRLSRSPVMALATAVAIAFSPFWIFYGQNSRPYAPFFLLLLLCLYFFRRALDTNGRAQWFGFALSGALAVYFHLYALPAIGALSLLVALRSLLDWRSRRAVAIRSFTGGVLGFLVFVVLSALPYVPPLLHGFRKQLPAGDELRAFDRAFLVHAAELLTGSAHSWFAVVLVAVSCAGLISLWRSDRLTVATVLTASAGGTLFTLIVRPVMYDVAIVFLRYNVALFALYFLGLSRVVERAAFWLHRRVRERRLFAEPLRVAVPLVAAFAGLIVAVSPIPATLAIQPNNFRQHAAYQEFYSGWDRNRVRGNDFFDQIDNRTTADIPAFYGRFLASPGNCRLIEYPLALYEYYVPYYFYQAHHGCEVLTGYTDDDQTGSMLHLRDNRALMRFRNLVDLQQPERIRAANADFLIVHHDLKKEVRGRRVRMQGPTRRVLQDLIRELGEPFHRDRMMTVFALEPLERRSR